MNSALIPGRKFAPENLGRVVILGLGKSGKACLEYLVKLVGTRVESLTLYGGASNAEATSWVEQFSSTGVTVIFDDEQVTGTYDLGIVSPGIPETSEFYKAGAAAAHLLISEVEFAWRESREDSRWIAITGTNGKTTTTALTAHIFNSAGWGAKAVGNIGDPCIEAVGADQTDIYVVETSSYQLASIDKFAPDAALMISLTPDHLSWHGSLEAYFAAKWKIISNIKDNDSCWLIANMTDETVASSVRKLSPEWRGLNCLEVGRPYPEGALSVVQNKPSCAWVNGSDKLEVALKGDRHELVFADDLQIKGPHNIVNSLMAASACLIFGLDSAQVDAGLLSFSPLEHRIEPCGCINGISFYNDSKATNVDATLVALEAFLPTKPIVLLGGRDKGTSLDPLVASCKENVKAVVCFGESRPRFEAAFKNGLSEDDSCTLLVADHLRDALEVALDFAVPGDIVLLSPACASFDEFNSFEERGQVFKQLVSSHEL